MVYGIDGEAGLLQSDDAEKWLLAFFRKRAIRREGLIPEGNPNLCDASALMTPISQNEDAFGAWLNAKLVSHRRRQPRVT